MNGLNGTRVMITGASGFLGSSLTRAMIELGGEVCAVVRPDSSMRRLGNLATNCHISRCDLFDSSELRRIVTDQEPEIIFHLVSYGTNSRQVDREEMIRTNIGGTLNLLEATRSTPYSLFIHTGSSLEYGKKRTPISEDALLEPLTFYGASKAAASLLVQQHARAFDKPILILRPFSIYGPWEDRSRLLPSAMCAFLCDEELKLTAPGFRRDFIFIDDVVEAYMLALRKRFAPGEIINIGTGMQWTNEDVVRQLEIVGGREIRKIVSSFPARPSDTDYWVANIGKARELLGWEPRHSLREGLDMTLRWFRSHLEFYESAGSPAHNP